MSHQGRASYRNRRSLNFWSTRNPGRREPLLQYDSGVNLSAVFETSHLGDGNYPPLLKGMLVKLSFELEADEIVTFKQAKPPSLQHLGEANYEFVRQVLRVYGDDEPLQLLIVIECSDFRFYVTGCALSCQVGIFVEGRGSLLLDTIFGWNSCLDIPIRPIVLRPAG